MRALAGVVGGIVAGFVIPVAFDQHASIATTIFIAIVFYSLSFGIAKKIAKNVPKDKRRKVATEGIVPFIFLLLTFMIIIYTALHQTLIIS